MGTDCSQRGVDWYAVAMSGGVLLLSSLLLGRAAQTVDAQQVQPDHDLLSCTSSVCCSTDMRPDRHVVLGWKMLRDWELSRSERPESDQSFG